MRQSKCASSLVRLQIIYRVPDGEQAQTSQLLLQEEPIPAFPAGPPILEAIARQPLLESSSSQSYHDGPDTEQQRKARRAQAQRLRRAAQSAEQRAAVAAADAARHAAARYVHANATRNSGHILTHLSHSYVSHT